MSNTIERWRKVCGTLPGGAEQYQYVAEHCRRRPRTATAVDPRVALYEKEIRALERAVGSAESILDRQRKQLASMPLLPGKPLTAAYLEEILEREREDYLLQMELPVLTGRLTAAFLDQGIDRTVAQRWGDLKIPRVHQKHLPLLKVAVLTAVLEARRQQLSTLVSAPFKRS